MLAPLVAGALGTFEGLLVSTVTLLVLFLGFCFLFNLPKLRATGRRSRVVRGLDEMLGVPQTYLPADAPHGTVDQLHTPELLERAGRRSA